MVLDLMFHHVLLPSPNVCNQHEESCFQLQRLETTIDTTDLLPLHLSFFLRVWCLQQFFLGVEVPYHLHIVTF